ncbi:hypothetical protein [Flectobacillus major]|uniref:hypothetical protein n=1 Tax=Flectobacillus major TaxID=103 RepID=UPI00118201F8|nr:hypothetical protein [Flectobacillus major]
MDNNFKYSYDPFGIVDFSISNVAQIVSPSSKPSKSKWFWWLLIVLIIIVLVFCGRAIYRYFVKRKEQRKANTDKVSYTPKVVAKIIPTPTELKIIAQFDLGNEANWDMKLLESKKAEGKAIFIGQKGWLVYA